MDYINTLRKHVGSQPLIMVSSAVFVLDAHNRLLMMKRSDNGCWSIPGGAMELGEAAEETAKRELFEEARLTLGHMSFFGVFSGKELYYRYPNGDEVYNVVVAYITRDAHGKVEMTDGEHLAFNYFDLSQLPEEISPPMKPILNKFLEINP